MAKVLVVDDSPSVRSVVERALKTRSIDVVSAASGTEAMAQIRREEPDLVVCDVVMPDMEGYELCDFVRDHPRLARTPVLLMSGVVNSAVLARAAEVRSSDVIRKPFGADELVSKIEGLLAHSRPLATGAVAEERTRPLSSMAVEPAAALEPVEDLKSLLGRLAALPGVSLAVFLDREGFLVESAGDMVLEAELAGALAAHLAQSSEGVGQELGQGALQGMILEYDSGIVLLNAAGSAGMLATVLADPAMLGTTRYHVKKALPELLAAV
jgi:twitching motility two-component system response regulator PilG